MFGQQGPRGMPWCRALAKQQHGAKGVQLHRATFVQQWGAGGKGHAAVGHGPGYEWQLSGSMLLPEYGSTQLYTLSFLPLPSQSFVLLHAPGTANWPVFCTATQAWLHVAAWCCGSLACLQCQGYAAVWSQGCALLVAHQTTGGLDAMVIWAVYLTPML